MSGKDHATVTRWACVASCNLCAISMFQVLKIDLASYQRRVMVMPDNTCPWAGLAAVGCARSCQTWLKVSHAALHSCDSATSGMWHECGSADTELHGLTRCQSIATRQGPYASLLSTSFHELGHNLGLQHSSTPGNEYGDGSCPMGACCGNRCLNAPQVREARRTCKHPCTTDTGMTCEHVCLLRRHG
jgi:hypothetical protein